MNRQLMIIRTRLYLTLVLLGILALLAGACTGQPTPTPTSEGKITVKQSGGAGMLTAECGDKDYISNVADYIIEGTVVGVESRWDENKTSIYTYTELSIDKYIKGAPFAENKLQIVTPGGTVEGISQWVEDQPIFHQGKKVRLYLQGKNDEFSIVCARFGVEDLELTPSPSSKTE